MILFTFSYEMSIKYIRGQQQQQQQTPTIALEFFLLFFFFSNKGDPSPWYDKRAFYEDCFQLRKTECHNLRII